MLLNHFVNKNQKVKPNKLEKNKNGKEETMGLVVDLVVTHPWIKWLGSRHVLTWVKDSNNSYKHKYTLRFETFFFNLSIILLNQYLIVKHTFSNTFLIIKRTCIS